MSELPPGWAWAKFGEIADSLRNGISVKPDSDQGLAILKISAVRPMSLRIEERRHLGHAPEYDAYRLSAGDLLFTRYNGNPTLVGVCAMVPELDETLVYPDKLIRAQLKPGFHPPFFEAAVNSGFSREWTQSRVRTTAGQCGISGVDLKSMPVPVPPFTEQRRIVAEIEKQFSRLDPSRAALVESTKKLDELISASIIRTCLLSTPDEIRLQRVDSVGHVTLGRQRAPKHHSGPNMRPYLRVANIYEDRIETDDVNHMNFTDAEFERYRLVEGDVLLNEGQSLELVGRPAIYRGEIPDCCFQNTLVRFKASSEVIPEYALYVFRAWLRAGEFQRVARWTTTMAHLGAERFAAMPFPLRPKASQQAIIEHLDSSLSSIAHLAGEIKRAATRAARLRQAILQKAIEGKLVPQDPNDEPASVLLERIRRARSHAPATPSTKGPLLMSSAAGNLVAKVWNYCNLLRDDGVSYGDYIEQLTYLLFLKMDHERTRPPYNYKSTIPEDYNWASLMEVDGLPLERHYRNTLENLAKEPGILGIIFRKAQNKIQNPAHLRRLIVDLIDKEPWSALSADVKGDIYEGLLEKNAQDTKSGAGQYFTPRVLIDAILEVMRPKPGDTIIDPAAGTGGFLLSAASHILKTHKLDRTQKRHLETNALYAVELVTSTARLCAMNLLLHGLGNERNIAAGTDSLAAKPSVNYDMVLTNPPFGKKSSVTIINQEGDEVKERKEALRTDFWSTTGNKQLNFLQHVRSLLKINGRAAVVLPDNVLFEGGAGETIRKRLLHDCDVHTLLRLPTGIFYAQGVKANVLFFDRKPASEHPWTRKLWIYDLRTNRHFTLKNNTLSRADLDDFVNAYNPENRHERTESERFHVFAYEDLIKRDKANLDIFWLRDDSLGDSSDLPDPAILAAEIIEDLQAALDQFAQIAADLSAGEPETERG